ncbi:c-type cytochrome [Hymenobacter terricola]|uniref:c-type cytochrome n=1 Tax=Hymenobacter terricola TaxID=2819236 RepID=UPI001B302712|nr:c-type cytochrome [Hymenobacter terricola]
MKKTALFLSLCALLAACNSGYKKDGPDEVSQQAASSAELKSDSTTGQNVAAVANQLQVDTSTSKIGTEHSGGLLASGAKLMAASDCASCHKEKEKLVGPAYADVAQKYPSNEANISMLANKIIQGGQGSWGAVPMTPHPGVTEADAREMVKYILTLK